MEVKLIEMLRQKDIVTVTEYCPRMVFVSSSRSQLFTSVSSCLCLILLSSHSEVTTAPRSIFQQGHLATCPKWSSRAFVWEKSGSSKRSCFFISQGSRNKLPQDMFNRIYLMKKCYFPKAVISECYKNLSFLIYLRDNSWITWIQTK